MADEIRGNADPMNPLSAYRFNQAEIRKYLDQVNQQVIQAESHLLSANTTLERAVARGDEKQVEAAKKQITQRTAVLKERRRPLEDYAAELRDLKLEVEAAEAQHHFAKNAYAIIREYSKPDTTALEEARLKLRHAEIAFNRQKNRYEHFKKAGDDLLPTEVSSTSPASFQDVTVLVAKAKIDAGVALDTSNVEMKNWPRCVVPEGAVNPKKDEWAGRTLSSALAAGMPVLVRQLAEKRKGDASTAVSDNKPASAEVVSPNSSRLTDQIKALEKYKDSREQAKLDSLDECLNVLATSNAFKSIETAMQEIDKRLTSGELKDLQDQSRACEALMRAAPRMHGNKAIAGPKERIRVGNTEGDPWSVVGLMVPRFSIEAKSSVYLKVLDENEPRAKYIALRDLAPLWNYVEWKEFPDLCEVVLASSASEDTNVRSASIDLLCNSLTISQRGPSAFNSPELKDKAKKLSDALPPERIITVVSTALSDQDPQKAFVVARAVISTSGVGEGSQQGARFDAPALVEQAIEVLLQLVGGNFHGTDVATVYRRNALKILSEIRSRQSVVALSLLNLLKSDKLDFRPKGNDSRFTRNEVLEVLSSNMPSEARGALPFLEDQILLLSLEQGENSKEVAKLRELIGRLKNENSPKK